MLIVDIRRGLGNQLFQYSFARALTEKYETKVTLNIKSDFRLHNYHLSDRLTIRHIDTRRILDRDYTPLQWLAHHHYLKKSDSISRDKIHLYEDRYRRMYRWAGVLAIYNRYVEMPEREPTRLWCPGYYQSERFFSHLRESLLQELTPIEPLMPENEQLMQAILESESVCVHMRLGDFVGNANCDLQSRDYYQRAVETMQALHPQATFFVFSNDIEQAKTQVRFRNESHFKTTPSPDFEDLRLMSACRHFVIANSSYGWWAQYLSPSENKTVIAPDRWFTTDFPVDIYMDNWLVIPA